MDKANSVNSDMYRATERATALGWFLSGTLIGPAFGPFLGGIIVTYVSWRVIFWLPTALGGFATASVLIGLPETIHRKRSEDMKGMKMRTMQSQVYVNFMKSMGASATPISWPELIPALKQNVVDGQENASSTIFDGKLYEVQKFMSVNEHIYGMHLVIVNDRFFTGLPEDQRQILMDGARMHAQVANARKSMDSIASDPHSVLSEAV